MTGLLNGSRPAAGLCRKVGCKHLLKKMVETAAGERAQTYCELSGRIPGNMLDCPWEPPVMKILSVRQPWASLIARGTKVMDIRSTDCHYRGPVAVYATRGNVRRKDMIYFKNILGEDPANLPHGKILCVVNLAGTIRFDNPDKFASYSDCHYLSPFFFEEGMTVYGWVFTDVKPLNVQLGFKMPKGCVNWSRINASVIEGYLTAPEVD